MLLSRRLKFGMSFDIFGTIRNAKEAFLAPRKHIKAFMEPSGSEHSIQTNLTADGFDEVSSEWQAHFGGNPFDLQTYSYLEGVQLTNFGTVDNPTVIFTADAPFRFVGCTGPTNEDDYESHELMYFLLREGPLQRCMYCGQVFKLVRLRNEFSTEMDYYSPNFNLLPWQDMCENEVTNTMSLKGHTQFETTVFENPENTVYSLISSDEHDRVLTDPAYRMQRKAEADMKAKVYLMAMQDYEKETYSNSPWREPLSKAAYENLIQAEVILRKLDRQFRQITKFHSRQYVDPANHSRREKRMLERSRKRWDNSYTIFSDELTEEIQRYRDYFETDLENYREDERLEEVFFLL